MRRYRNAIVDSTRWQRFDGRAGDVIITTPSKCGTTWMQHLVGMLLLDTAHFDAPLSTFSPWFDSLTSSDEQVFELLAAQHHRRLLKTHVPLDGLPERADWTYLAVFRHPLDAALSWRDHSANVNRPQLRELVVAVTGEAPPAPAVPPPAEPHAFLRHWIASTVPPDGSSLHGLADFANTLQAAWARRTEPNVHLFHYDDLWNDLDGQFRRLEQILGVAPDASLHAAMVEAGTFDAMRNRAPETAPFAGKGVFADPAAFFRQGGRRNWASLLDASEITAVERELERLAGPEAAAWALRNGSVAEPR